MKEKQQTGKDRNENVDFGALEGDTGERHEVNQRGRVKKKTKTASMRKRDKEGVQNKTGSDVMVM